MTQANSRTADHPIDPLFLERWSPRAFTDAPISERELLMLLEAVRWAPSSFNSQPWRFLYARRHAGGAAYTHSLDAGAAWANLALQAARSGWAAHGMAGFDVPRTAADLGVPAGFRVEAAIAIGRPGDKSNLPEPLRAREQPSDRLPLSQLAWEGRFRTAS